MSEFTDSLMWGSPRRQMEKVFGEQIEYQRDGFPSAWFLAVPEHALRNVWSVKHNSIIADEMKWIIRVSALNAAGFGQPESHDRIIQTSPSWATEEGTMRIVCRVLADADGKVWEPAEVDGVEFRVNTKLIERDSDED